MLLTALNIILCGVEVIINALIIIVILCLHNFGDDTNRKKIVKTAVFVEQNITVHKINIEYVNLADRDTYCSSGPTNQLIG